AGQVCDNGGPGHLMTALAFGLVIVAMAYSIGNVSGCHINPAVFIPVTGTERVCEPEFSVQLDVMLPLTVQVHRDCDGAAVPCALHDADVLALIIILIKYCQLSACNLRTCVPYLICLDVVAQDA
ncbi:MAG: aquaporin, partial [Spirochaetales bacterium]|nr:aquaporin [Spirochaetales bacterium]